MIYVLLRLMTVFLKCFKIRQASSVTRILYSRLIKVILIVMKAGYRLETNALLFLSYILFSFPPPHSHTPITTSFESSDHFYLKSADIYGLKKSNER